MLRVMGWVAGRVGQVAVGLLVTVAGCGSVDLLGGLDVETPDPPANGITVQLVNLHPTAAVDIELFVSDSAVTDFDTELFTDANRVENLGFAGTGFVPRLQAESITFSCGEAVVIGTSGPRFVDPDSNELLGTGEQRILERDATFSCGDVIVFEFEEVGGSFVTRLSVE